LRKSLGDVDENRHFSPLKTRVLGLETGNNGCHFWRNLVEEGTGGDP
jgi:hypothetical protein